MSDVKSITVQKLNEEFQNGTSLVVLYVRRADERSLAKISVPGTVTDLFIPMNECQTRVNEIKAAIGTNRSLVVYCHHGMRSQAVANWLVGLGISDVLNLIGGIDSWSAHVDSSVAQY